MCWNILRSNSKSPDSVAISEWPASVPAVWVALRKEDGRRSVYSNAALQIIGVECGQDAIHCVPEVWLIHVRRPTDFRSAWADEKRFDTRHGNLSCAVQIRQPRPANVGTEDIEPCLKI